MRTWKLITTILAAGLIAGGAAACGGESDAAAPGAAPTATSAAAPPADSPGSATPTKAPSRSTTSPVSGTGGSAKASGSGNPQFGTQYAILKSSQLSTRQITYDLIEWYDGKEAVKACAEDGVKPAENDYCEGYYIRNNNKKLRTLTVHPDAPVRMAVNGEMKSVELETFLSEVRGQVIKFDIDANRIVKLDHVYLP